MSARYLIGIDLGTTNSSVAFVDLNREKNPACAITSFLIPQLTEKGTVEHLPFLPSYCFIVSDSHKKRHHLPWKKELSYLLGQAGWEEGSKIPTQLVHSAKSWLCHPHAHLKGSLLPENAVHSIGRISPLEASARYLNHIRESWNYIIAKNDGEKQFESQDIVITIPASFDETARALTLEAAKLAGYPSLVMLEEPQAAFYCWMANNEKHFDKHLQDNDVILVVDVGGGTTDFSLIKVQKKEELFTFDRIAVGKHLLLGGDNIDSAIAHYIHNKMHNEGVETCASLKFAARKAKEVLLAENAPETYKVLMQGKGASVVANTKSIVLNKKEIEEFLKQGFFGDYSYEEAKQVAPKKGIKHLGLPFEEEPSIVKHLAQFLDKAQVKPDKVLFNGGTLKPFLFRSAILSALQKWFSDKNITSLETTSYDFSVAHGAAQFAKVRIGDSTRIRGGSPRTYFVEVNCDGIPKHVTLLERGAEEDMSYPSPFIFHLLPNTPVSFKVYASHTKLKDKLGEFTSFDDLEMFPLPELQTVLKYGQTKDPIPVYLEAKLTSIGVLEMGLSSQLTEHKWKLEFSIGKDDHLNGVNRVDVNYDEGSIKPALHFIDEFFFKNLDKNFMEELEHLLQAERHLWPVSVLRKFSDHLLSYKSVPKKNERYWNALGFFLRPGFGYPLDEHRIKLLWKMILANPQEKHIQKWICYRRISGGLNKGQQLQLAQELMGAFQWKGEKLPTFRNKNEWYEFSEKLRAVASFEWLDSSKKIALGNAILNKISQEPCQPFEAYALSRMGARNLLYAPFTQALSKEVVEAWLTKIISLKEISQENKKLIYMQLSRNSPHSHLNISKKIKDQILATCSDINEILDQDHPLTHEQNSYVYMDSFPIGLMITSERLIE